MPEKNIKVVFLGEKYVGKTSLIMRYIYNLFNSHYSTTEHVDFRRATVLFGDEELAIDTWDLSGGLNRNSTPPSYFRGCHAAVLVYEVSNIDSFRHLDWWNRLLDEYTAGGQVVKMVIANKIDRTDVQVSGKQGQTWALTHGALFRETSAKSRTGVEDSFAILVQQVMKTSVIHRIPIDRAGVVTLHGNRGRRFLPSRPNPCCE